MALAGSSPLSLWTATAFFHDRSRVKQVIEAVADLPTTNGPSHFVLAAQAKLPSTCMHHGRNSTSSEYSCRGTGYPAAGLVGSMANWHRALCAPPDDPSWGGTYDPAYQPQQEALTIGFMCMLACDCNYLQLSGQALAALAASDGAAHQARAALCAALPWGATNFTKAGTSVDALAAAAAPLAAQLHVCGCHEGR